MRQALWKYTDRGRRPFSPRRKVPAKGRPLTAWLTKGILACIILFLVWVGAQSSTLRHYLRYVFVPGAASVSPLSRWLDWYPEDETVQPVWSRLTGRSDMASYNLPVAGTVQPADWSGINIVAPPGELVRAVLDGRVTALDNNLGEVRVFHGTGMYTIYRDLSDLAVTLGDRVAARDVLGRVGSSGRVFFAVLQGGNYVDPLVRVHGR